MPIYEYKCQQTGNVYEVNQSINADPLTYCTMPGCECGGTGAVQRLISKNVGVIFNGSGFYETDYLHKHRNPVQEIDHSSCCANCSDSNICPSAQVSEN